MRKARAFIFIGVPGSGKSTYTNEVIDVFRKRGELVVVVCPDDIRKELTGSIADQTKNREVFEIAHRRYRENLKKGNHVIFDATSVTKKTRKQLIKLADSAKASKIAVYVNVSKVKAKKQNSKRDRKVPDHIIDRMYSQLQVPTHDEGFDVIINATSKSDITRLV